MAVYEYFCEKCDTKFQLSLPIGKAEERIGCPSCKSLSRRIYSGFLIFSKGEKRSSQSPSSSRCTSCVTKSCSTCI